MATSRASSARAAVDLTFEELYRGHRADVYRAALRELGNAHDAEDVTQAAFVDAYRAVLRGTRPQSPRAWLLAISENVRRRRFRTAQRRPREDLVEDADFPLTADLPHEQSRALSEALAALPPEQRRVFVLREVVGLTYVEIAAELDSTVASVQMLLFRARRSLRDQLDPPTVSRRPIFLPPLPGWLVGLWSRIEVATLTPRAAGALGAAVLTIAGASVAVPVPQAARAGRGRGERSQPPPSLRPLLPRRSRKPVRRRRRASESVPSGRQRRVRRSGRVRPQRLRPLRRPILHLRRPSRPLWRPPRRRTPRRARPRRAPCRRSSRRGWRQRSWTRCSRCRRRCRCRRFSCLPLCCLRSLCLRSLCLRSRCHCRPCRTWSRPRPARRAPLGRALRRCRFLRSLFRRCRTRPRKRLQARAALSSARTHSREEASPAAILSRGVTVSRC